ncbi:MAG: FAD-dependent oxidoreductase [Chloroflexota bacterium]|nr:FAD-dependent oxidoreductase [Chloroflexota bacterium]
MNNEFDAIIVGGGPAGCAAAYSLAKANLQVLLIERGKFAGAKNMIGGMLFGKTLDDLIPQFWEDAPVERYITRHVTTFLSEGGSLSLDARSEGFGVPPYNGFSVLRAKFDKWFAQQAEKAGAIVITNMKVDDLLWDGGRVAGVISGGDKLPANVVIAADGVNSIIAQKAGLRGELSTEDINQGVKEVIKLPRETIEDRFNLSGDEGAAYTFVGISKTPIHAGGFIYSNKDTLSLGVVAQLSALIKNQVKAPDLLEEFKSHPMVRNLIKDGVVAEYSAHPVPAGGRKMMPRLFSDGIMVVGDAAGMVLTTGLALEGTNFAMKSGAIAAEVVKKAKEVGNYSAATLRQYETLLSDGFVLKDLNTFKGSPAFMENPRIYGVYPEIASRLFERIYASDGTPRKKIWQMAREEMKGRVSMWQLIKDGIQGIKNA